MIVDDGEFQSKLGWMYEYAFEESQRYKESKVILECALINEMPGIPDPLDQNKAVEMGYVDLNFL